MASLARKNDNGIFFFSSAEKTVTKLKKNRLSQTCTNQSPLAMKTCPNCKNDLKWVCEDTFLRHPQHTIGQLENKGIVWCDHCDLRQVVDPWASDGTVAVIQRMVEPPFVEWQANHRINPAQVREEMLRRIEENGMWQAPLGWKHMSCLSFLSPQTTETDQLNDQRFNLSVLDHHVEQVFLNEFSGYYLLRCLSPTSNNEFDFIFFNMPSQVPEESVVMDELAQGVLMLTKLLTKEEERQKRKLRTRRR